jgi:hypothetical protein
MKVFFKAALFVLASHFAMAQGIEIGAKGSLNLSNIPNFDAVKLLGQDLKYMTTGGMGIFAEIPLDANFSVRPEVSYNRRGGQIERLNLGNSTLGNIFGSLINGKLNLDYLDVPVLLKYKFGTPEAGRAYIVAGPSLGILLRGSMSNNLLGIVKLNYDMNLNYRDIDFAGVAGIGYETPLKGKLKGFVEATYRQSFTNAVKDIGILKVDSKTNNFGISAGVSMPIGK